MGKTTALTKIVNALRREGIKVGGMVTRESRTNGEREGFIVSNLGNGTEGWLAKKGLSYGPQVGKYRVCIKDLESIGVKAILDAIVNAEVVVIDEIGPMELSSASFNGAVLRALESNKTVLGTIHYRTTHPLIHTIKNKETVRIFEVTVNNRNELPNLVTKEILGRTLKN
ncbi:NTPase [Candidatus Bathyarchaeota archaeon]|nr:NTPase [Candidatus Bathyarchaeota archaeon]